MFSWSLSAGDGLFQASHKHTHHPVVMIMMMLLIKMLKEKQEKLWKKVWGRCRKKDTILVLPFPVCPSFPQNAFPKFSSPSFLFPSFQACQSYPTLQSAGTAWSLLQTQYVTAQPSQLNCCFCLPPSQEAFRFQASCQFGKLNYPGHAGALPSSKGKQPLGIGSH